MNYPPKNPILLLCLLFFQYSILAQDKLPIKFGKVSIEDFNVKSSLIDSNTSAIVVADVGSSEFIANTHEVSFSLIFKESKRIKIINKNGFDAATVTIPLFVSDAGKAERMEELEAVTYNIENGKVSSVKLDKPSVFTEKHSKNWIYKKFTFPALKEGSIIEYSYRVKSDFFFNLQRWIFQGVYPVLWSQYDADIPDFYKFAILSQGYHPFAVNTVKKTGASFSFIEHSVKNVSGNLYVTSRTAAEENSFKIAGSIDAHTWIMKDVPALKEEPYTTTISNAVSKIEFQLKQVAFPDMPVRDVTDSWQKVSEELLIDEDFGVPISNANNWLDAEMGNIVRGASTQKEKAGKIYEYVRDNYTSKPGSTFYVSMGLKEPYKNKNGSTAEINMLLIAMLRHQKITADPIILSTRNNGVTNEYYPLMDRYNHVIARVSIENEVIYLDATESRLAFGKLPLQDYNGHARIITNEARPVYFTADSVNETSTISVFIENGENGEMTGNFTNNLGYYRSLNIRSKLAARTIDDFTKELRQSYPSEIELSNVTIDSLRLLDEPVAVYYDLKFKSFGNDDIVYFNPMLSEAVTKNPFAAAERFYPVEMPYAIDETYTLNMDIPIGYKVDELPKSARVMLNENEGMFEYIISSSETKIQLRRKLVLKKANYLNEDYKSLRDFFAAMVSKEAEQIVFKKIK